MKIAFGHFRHVRSLQWKIECYHHALKEVCHVRRFFVRWKGAIHNHVFCSLRAFLKLEHRRFTGQISSWYQFKRHLADQASRPSSNRPLNTLTVRNSCYG